MILSRADFWIGFFSALLFICLWIRLLFFPKAHKTSREIFDSLSAYPEYEEYKRIRKTLPRENVTNYPNEFSVFSLGKPYPDSEMSEPEKLGLEEETKRRQALLFIENWESRFYPIVGASFVALFYLIGAKIIS